MNRLAAAGTCIAAALALAACGSTSGISAGPGHSNVVNSPASAPPSPTTATAPTLQIVAKGFTQLSPDAIGNSYVTYAAVLKWASTSEAASQISVNISLTGAAGQVLSAKTETIGAMLPGETTAVANDDQVSGVTGMDVQALVGSKEPYNRPPPTLTVTNITSSNDGFQMKTTGTVASTATKDLKNTEAVAVYYDGGGHILGGANQFIDFIPAGGSTGVEVDGTNVVPNVASTQVFVQISNLTLLTAP